MRIDGSQAWRGAALARNRRPRDICLDAWMIGNPIKQAAPGNVSTRVGFVARRADDNLRTERWAKHRVR
jgi:hypothetical protein